MATNDLQNEQVPEGGDEAAPTQDELSLQEQLQTAQSQVTEVTDKYKRSVAEFANYRKRQEREWQLQRQRVTMDVLEKLLPLMDDLDLALDRRPASISEAEGEVGSWLEGIGLIRHKLDAVLDSYGVQPIEALGQRFDPLFHEALLHAPSADHPAGMVMAELRKGYIVGDLVLRPTRVAVSSGAAAKA